MSDRYQIQVWSSPDHDQLVAEIYIDGRFIGLLSQENWPDPTMTLEWGDDPKVAGMKVELTVFEQALAAAKARLVRLDSRKQER